MSKKSVKTLEILEDNKDNITEGLYLQLCNSLKDLHQEEELEEENKENYYTVNYLYTENSKCQDREYRMRMMYATQILKMSTKIYQQITTQIKKYGCWRCCNHDDILSELCYYGNEKELTCEDDSLQHITDSLCFGSITLISDCKIIKITPDDK
jgi:hypothetical protein